MQIEIQELIGFNSVGKSKNKKQILLTNTSRTAPDYISSLRHRYNGEYTKLPHFIIRKDGRIFQFIPTDTYSNLLEDSKNFKQVIVITLENLGWLKKNPLNASYINWIGNIYKEGVYERKWRGHFFWDPYTGEQIESLKNLCVSLCEEYDIPKTIVGHNVKIDGIERYVGIATNSNYTTTVTYLSPAFDFEEFEKIFENELL